MNQELLTQAADEQGNVNIEQEAVEPDISVDINIRDDEVRMLESQAGRLFLETDEMEDDLLVEVVPTMNGAIAELVVDTDRTELEVIEPAERDETDVTRSGSRSNDGYVLD